MSRLAPALAIALSALALLAVVLARLDEPDAASTDLELSRLHRRLAELEALLARPSAERAVASEHAAEGDHGDDSLGAPDVTGALGDSGAGGVGSPSAVDALLTRVDALEARLRGLEEDPTQRAFAYLSSTSPELRRRGVHQLEELAKHDPEARRAIYEMLADADPGVRASALDTLADISDEDVIPSAAALLEDPSPEVRRQAIDALTRLEAKEAAPEIAPFLADEDDEVRRQAADSLGKLGYTPASAALLDALDDPNLGVRGEAISSLGEVGATEALPRLRELYSAQQDAGAHREADHRVRLAMAMKQLGDRDAVQSEIARLGELVHYRDDGGAMRALLWIGRDEPAATEVFRKAAEVSRTEWIRREARRMVERNGGERRE